jgi:hypothetical protein
MFQNFDCFQHSAFPPRAAGNAHGDASFRYEIVEDVTDDNPLLIPSMLKDREKHWRAQLNAAAVTA